MMEQQQGNRCLMQPHQETFFSQEHHRQRAHQPAEETLFFSQQHHLRQVHQLVNDIQMSRREWLTSSGLKLLKLLN